MAEIPDFPGVPLPGTPDAREKGCTCPAPARSGVFVECPMERDCPVHRPVIDKLEERRNANVFSKLVDALKRANLQPTPETVSAMFAISAAVCIRRDLGEDEFVEIARNTYRRTFEEYKKVTKEILS